VVRSTQATGDFVFGVAEGYLIENGKVAAPVRGATLIGNGIEVLLAIDAIADDLEVKAGMCGKEGQFGPCGKRTAYHPDPRADGRGDEPVIAMAPRTEL